MAQVGKWRLDNRIKEPVDYVFDWLEVNDPQRLELVEVLEASCERGDALEKLALVTGGYSFRHKETLAPLQAADIFAWTLFNANRHHLDLKPATLLAKETYNDYRNHNDQLWMDAGGVMPDQMKDFGNRAPLSEVIAGIKPITPRRQKRR